MQNEELKTGGRTGAGTADPADRLYVALLERQVDTRGLRASLGADTDDLPTLG